VSPTDLVVAAMVMLVGAMIQGGVGFGMNLLAAPLLALIEPDLIPAPLLIAAMSLTLLVAHRDRAAADRRGVSWALTGRVPGTVAGALLVAWISARGITIAVGVAVLAAAALNLRDLGLRPTPRALVIAGVASGFSDTVSSVGGPPLAVVYANEPGPVVRSTLSTIFVIGGALSIASLAIVGKVGRDQLLAALALQPPLLVGFALSRRLATHLDAGRTRVAVLAVSTAGAVAIIVKALA
jgi:uncharacterized membrane protein YfcA